MRPLPNSRSRRPHCVFREARSVGQHAHALLQIFLTGRLMKFLGVTVTLLFMPVLSLFGFAAMGLVPVLAVLAVFQVSRRASTFAFMRPAREVLFTVLR